MPGGLGAALMSSLCFVGYQILEAHRLVDPPGRELYAQGRASGIIDAYMHTSMFLLVGTVGGYLADRIRHKGRALRHAETALEQLRVDTNYILENMSSGVLVVDSVCRVVTMNLAAEEILEVKKDDVLGKHIDEALGRRVPDLAHELVQSLSMERSKRRHEIAAHTRDGKDRPLGGANGSGSVGDDDYAIWKMHYGEGNLLVPSAIPGDFNHDNFVSAADYTIWRNSRGTSGNNLPADANGNGSVDDGDYAIWKMHFGEASGNGGGSAAAPEPSGLLLMLFAATVIAVPQRRRPPATSDQRLAA